jgi:hypothetical protein
MLMILKLRDHGCPYSRDSDGHELTPDTAYRLKRFSILTWAMQL